VAGSIIASIDEKESWQKFFATSSSHVCSDDFFKAQALIVRKEETAEKTKVKENLLAEATIWEKGMELLVAGGQGRMLCIELLFLCDNEGVGYITPVVWHS
jgi:hypothetical protein